MDQEGEQPVTQGQVVKATFLHYGRLNERPNSTVETDARKSGARGSPWTLERTWTRRSFVQSCKNFA